MVEIVVSNGRLQVSDDGPGIAPELADTIFQPFFTTRTRGTGLGLSICRKLAQAMGSKVELGRGTLGGACFVLQLIEPAAGSAWRASSPSRPSRPSGEDPHHARVLGLAGLVGRSHRHVRVAVTRQVRTAVEELTRSSPVPAHQK